MINCQKFNFLQFLTINSVTIGVRELNRTSQISLVTHNATDLDEVSSDLARMTLCNDSNNSVVKFGKTLRFTCYNVIKDL